MNVNDELTQDLDVLTPVVNDLIAAYKQVQQLDADLTAQIAAGAERNLSVEQSAAFASRISDLKKSMQDALAPAVVEPTPDTPIVPVDPSAMQARQ